MRVSQFDEEIKHLIPDLEALFKRSLFEQGEKAILAGLGFIDVVDGATSTRRESILNPGPFIQEVTTGVDDFKQLLKELMFLIKDKNESHVKYMNVDCKITSSPIKGFMTDKFKERIRQLWDRGSVSTQTAVEIIGEVEFEIELKRREKEKKDGVDKIMSPHKAEVEKDKVPIVSQKIKTDKNIPDVKVDPTEKKNFKRV